MASSDEKAFEVLYRRYWLKIFRYAVSRVEDPNTAEDLCHDVFLSLWNRRESLSIQTLEAYLIQAIKYGVIGFLKSRLDKHIVSYPEDLKDLHTEQLLAFNGLYEAWNKAINQIPDKSRVVFQLSKVQHYSNKEIAAQLKLSEKAVEYHMSKALGIMRKHLKDFSYIFL
jgi:RNA polymerase sigma-70 factor (family 1)